MQDQTKKEGFFKSIFSKYYYTPTRKAGIEADAGYINFVHDGHPDGKRILDATLPSEVSRDEFEEIMSFRRNLPLESDKILQQKCYDKARNIRDWNESPYCPECEEHAKEVIGNLQWDAPLNGTGE